MPRTPSKRKPRKKKTGAATKRAGETPERAEVVRRLWLAADAQAKQLEKRLVATLAPAERERDTRTMAVLVKTLRDLGDLDGARGKRAAKNEDDAGAGATAEVNHDDPRQIDDFRRELARRIEAIKAGGNTEPAGES